MIQVKSKTDGKKVSKEHMIRALSPKDTEKVKKSLDTVINEVAEQTAINKLILAGFYEENNLLIDAIGAYEEAIKLAPDVASFQEAYDEFLLRHNLRK
jgi:Tfp pilus assembly protein PilF